MLRYIKWAFWVVIIGFLAIVLNYTLPQRDVVYISGVDNRLEQVGANSIFWSSPDSGTSTEGNLIQRDVRFIDSTQRNGEVMVYRNEDTGFWPPYFKFDSANLHAEARNLISRSDAPQWVIVTHYGWRIPFLSAYPNAISVTPTDNPDAFLVPWFNIVFLLILIALIWGITVRVRRFGRGRSAS